MALLQLIKGVKKKLEHEWVSLCCPRDRQVTCPRCLLPYDIWDKLQPTVTPKWISRRKWITGWVEFNTSKLTAVATSHLIIS